MSDVDLGKQLTIGDKQAGGYKSCSITTGFVLVRRRCSLLLETKSSAPSSVGSCCLRQQGHTGLHSLKQNRWNPNPASSVEVYISVSG
jgi:hypothetical protein